MLESVVLGIVGGALIGVLGWTFNRLNGTVDKLCLAIDMLAHRLDQHEAWHLRREERATRYTDRRAGDGAHFAE